MLQGTKPASRTIEAIKISCTIMAESGYRFIHWENASYLLIVDYHSRYIETANSLMIHPLREFAKVNCDWICKNRP